MKPLHACLIDQHIFGGTSAGPSFDAWRCVAKIFGALHAALQDYRDRLGLGEFATVALIASDRRQARQARQALNYVTGLIEDSGVIKAEVVNETAGTITFAHRVQLEASSASLLRVDWRFGINSRRIEGLRLSPMYTQTAAAPGRDDGTNASRLAQCVRASMRIEVARRACRRA
jgi:hypothetical protein